MDAKTQCEKAGAHMNLSELQFSPESEAGSRRTLSTLLGNLPGMAYRCRNEPGWAMDFVSDGASDLTGYTPVDLVHSGTVAYGDLILPEFREPVWDAVQAAISAHSSFRITYRIRTKDGSTKWVWEQGCGVFDELDRLLCIEGFITDIEDRMQNTERLELRVAERTAELTAAHQGAQRQLDQMSTLTAITSELLGAADLETVLQIVVRAASTLCRASGAMVGLVDSNSSTLNAVAAHGEPREYFENFKRPTLDARFLEGTATGRALKHRRPVVVENYGDWDSDHELRRETMNLGVKAFVVAPLLIDGEAIGVLWVNDVVPRGFDVDDVILVQALADQSTLAIQHARLAVRAKDAVAIEERARLARDLHDSVTQSIYSIGLMAGTAIRQHEQQAPELPRTLDMIRDLAEESLGEMRGLLYELLPPILQDNGLSPAVEKLVAAMRLRTTAPIMFEGVADVSLGVERETAVFRIVQEALANAIKHSQASVFRVALSREHDVFRAEVLDNGVGFDPAGLTTTSGVATWNGIGMRSMRERATATGLLLRVTSQAGATTVTVEAAI